MQRIVRALAAGIMAALITGCGYRFIVPSPPPRPVQPSQARPLPTAPGATISTPIPAAIPTSEGSALPGEPLMQTDLGDGYGYMYALSPDGKSLAVGRVLGVMLVDLESQEDRWDRDTDLPVISLDWSPDGSKIAVGYGEVTYQEDGSIISTIGQSALSVLDAGTGEELWYFDSTELGSETRAAFSPDGQKLAAVFASPYLRVWDAASGEQIAEVERIPYAMTAVEWSGSWIAVGTDTSGLLLIEGSAYEVWTELTEHYTVIGAFDVAMAAESQYAALASGDGHVTIYATEPPGLQSHIVADETRAQAVTFSADRYGTLLFIATPDAITVWESMSQKPVGSLSQAWVYTLEFLPDGTTLFAGSTDGTIALWDLSTLDLE